MLDSMDLYLSYSAARFGSENLSIDLRMQLETIEWNRLSTTTEWKYRNARKYPQTNLES